MTIDKSEPVAGLLAGIGEAHAEDKTTPRELASLPMVAEPAVWRRSCAELRDRWTESDSP